MREDLHGKSMTVFLAEVVLGCRASWSSLCGKSLGQEEVALRPGVGGAQLAPPHKVSTHGGWRSHYPWVSQMLL